MYIKVKRRFSLILLCVRIINIFVLLLFLKVGVNLAKLPGKLQLGQKDPTLLHPPPRTASPPPAPRPTKHAIY